MKINSIQYARTLELNKLVYKKLIIDRVVGIISVILPTGLLLFIFINFFPKILENEPKEVDYILAFLLPIMTVGFGLYKIRGILQRNRLKEVVYSVDFETAKKLIFETAQKINWNLLEKSGNVITFKTDRNPFLYRQEITIILTPEKQILFNSSPGKDFTDVIGFQTLFSYYPSKFSDNFTNFQANFKRLEQEKTAANIV